MFPAASPGYPVKGPFKGVVWFLGVSSSSPGNPVRGRLVWLVVGRNSLRTNSIYSYVASGSTEPTTINIQYVTTTNEVSRTTYVHKQMIRVQPHNKR